MKELQIDLQGLTMTMEDMLKINDVLKDRQEYDKAHTILDAIKILIDVRDEIVQAGKADLDRRIKEMES